MIMTFLYVHTGCEITSAFFGIGKNKILTLKTNKNEKCLVY